MESVLQVESGQTVVLGGLMQDDVSKSTDAVPGISKLPLVGKLFQAHDDVTKKTELVIFLRSTIIPNASLDSDELKSFKQFLPSQQLSVTSDEPAN
jgi:general secretion pathway protein D